MKKLLPLAVLAALSSVHVASAQAADVSAAVGATGQSGMTYRLGLSWDWDKSWWQTSTGRLTGYWDAGYTYWEGGDEGAGKHSLSFAPVFVYEFAGDSIKPFIEAGIGVAAFSGTRVGDQNLGSSLNFEDRIGAGLKFANGQSVGVRAIHYSNAGLKQPNDGIRVLQPVLQDPDLVGTGEKSRVHPGFFMAAILPPRRAALWKERAIWREAIAR